MARRQFHVIAGLVLTAGPVLAAQPALRCADLSPESLTNAQYAAFATNVPVLHAYLKAGLFHDLDARQRFRVVSQATTGAANWADATLPDPYYAGDAVLLDTMLSSYMTACDNTLRQSPDTTTARI